MLVQSRAIYTEAQILQAFVAEGATLGRSDRWMDMIERRTQQSFPQNAGASLSLFDARNRVSPKM